MGRCHFSTASFLHESNPYHNPELNSNLDPNPEFNPDPKLTSSADPILIPFSQTGSVSRLSKIFINT